MLSSIRKQKKGAPCGAPEMRPGGPREEMKFRGRRKLLSCIQTFPLFLPSQTICFFNNFVGDYMQQASARVKAGSVPASVSY